MTYFKYELKLEPTGYCWQCGKLCAKPKLFCRDVCERKYKREHRYKEPPKHGALT